METAHGLRKADFIGSPSRPLIVRILDHLDRQTRGMLEVEERLSETFVNTAMDDPVPVQVIHPEWKGSLADCIYGGLNLPGSRPALYPIVRKGGHNRSRL